MHLTEIENNKECSKFKVGDHIRKYWSEEAFAIKTVQKTDPTTYVISDLQGEEIIGFIYQKELQKQNKKNFR